MFPQSLDHLVGAAVTAQRACQPRAAARAAGELADACGRDLDFVHACIRQAARAGTGAAVLDARDALTAGPRRGRHRARRRRTRALLSGGRREQR